MTSITFTLMMRYINYQIRQITTTLNRPTQPTEHFTSQHSTVRRSDRKLVRKEAGLGAQCGILYSPFVHHDYGSAIN